jgi:hypothetical protein
MARRVTPYGSLLAELRPKAPDPDVVHWFLQRSAGTLYLSVLAQGEICTGIEALPDPPRRRVLLDSRRRPRIEPVSPGMPTWRGARMIRRNAAPPLKT